MIAFAMLLAGAGALATAIFLLMNAVQSPSALDIFLAGASPTIAGMVGGIIALPFALLGGARE